MSYDVELRHPQTGEVLPVAAHMDGPNVAIRVFGPLDQLTPRQRETFDEAVRGYFGQIRPGQRLMIVPDLGVGIEGGISEAEMSVTYNYGHLIREHLHPEGLRHLDEMTGAESIPLLQAAVAALGTTPYEGMFLHVPFGARGPLAERLREIDDLDRPEHAGLVAEGLAMGVLADGGAYWKPTPGNVGRALGVMLGWARQHPTGVWHIT